MKVTAAQLAQLLEGSLEGDPNATVSRPARIEEAKEGDFAFLDNARYESYAYTTKASILTVAAVIGTVILIALWGKLDLQGHDPESSPLDV